MRAVSLPRLLAYAVGLVLSVGVALLASSRDWSGTRLFLVGLGVAGVYTVFILVPALLYEQARNSSRRTRP